MSGPAFLDNLRRSRLLSEKQLAAIAPLAAEGEAKALAKVLVLRGWMTPFQVKQVAAGKPDYLRLGDFILLERIGEGAMGEVYRASHVKHGAVALKIMKREKLGNPSAVKRFLQEMELALKLQHPNIVRAIDCGMADDSYYLAMELIDGVDLSRLVKQEGPLGIEQACHYIRQAALALHHAHQAGVIHRDLKPGNIMVDREGTVKLLDLGLARQEAYENNNALTRLGQMIGTPDYLAPEQALDARRADARADIYSLGCALFYLVAGKPPFTAGSLADLLLKHQSEAARPLKSFRPEAPDWLEQLIGWMMNKKPEHRPATALEVAQKIDALLPNYRPAGPPPLPAPPPPPDPWAGLDDEKPAPRNRGGVGWFAAVLIGLLLLGAGAVAWVFLRPLPTPQKEANGGTEKKQPTGEKPKPKPEEKEKPKEQPREKSKDKPKPPPKVKGVAQKDGHLVFQGHTKRISLLAVSDDGKLAATAGRDGQLVVWDLARSEEKWRKKPGGAILQMQFRRGLLDCRSGNKVLAWQIAGGENDRDKLPAGRLLAPRTSLALPIEKNTLTAPSGPVVLAGSDRPPCIDFHPKKDRLLAMTPNGPIVVGTKETFRYEVRPTDLAGRITYAIFGPGGEGVYYGTENGQVYFDSVGKAALQVLGEKVDGAVTALALSPDGKQLVAGSAKGSIVLFDLTKPGAPSRVLGKVKSVAVVKLVNQRAIVGDSEGALHVWDLLPART